MKKNNRKKELTQIKRKLTGIESRINAIDAKLYISIQGLNLGVDLLSVKKLLEETKSQTS